MTEFKVMLFIPTSIYMRGLEISVKVVKGQRSINEFKSNVSGANWYTTQFCQTGIELI